MVNINPDTGIAYGYINTQCLSGFVLGDIENAGEDEYYKDALSEYIQENRRDKDGKFRPYDELEQEFNDQYNPQEPVLRGEYQGVQFRTSWLGGAQHLWVFKSPILWRCTECSPCVPYAGNLDDFGKGSYLAYGVPLDWLDDVFLEERFNAVVDKDDSILDTITSTADMRDYLLETCTEPAK